jgi:hypothetical protein
MSGDRMLVDTPRRKIWRIYFPFLNVIWLLSRELI